MKKTIHLNESELKGLVMNLVKESIDLAGENSVLWPELETFINMPAKATPLIVTNTATNFNFYSDGMVYYIKCHRAVNDPAMFNEFGKYFGGGSYWKVIIYKKKGNQYVVVGKTSFMKKAEILAAMESGSIGPAKRFYNTLWELREGNGAMVEYASDLKKRAAYATIDLITRGGKEHEEEECDMILSDQYKDWFTKDSPDERDCRFGGYCNWVMKRIAKLWKDRLDQERQSFEQAHGEPGGNETINEEESYIDQMVNRRWSRFDNSKLKPIFDNLGLKRGGGGFVLTSDLGYIGFKLYNPEAEIRQYDNGKVVVHFGYDDNAGAWGGYTKEYEVKDPDIFKSPRWMDLVKRGGVECEPDVIMR